jgi:hypothetical protein
MRSDRVSGEIRRGLYNQAYPVVRTGGHTVDEYIDPFLPLLYFLP